MSYITYSPNEVVYIRGIGYATLVNCGARATVSQKIEAQPQKKESIYFDPDLFNSDLDSDHSKKSQPKSEQEKIEKKLIEVIAEKNTKDEVLTQKGGETEKKLVEQAINIVQAKLDGGTMVYTSDKELSKTIFITIKPFLLTIREQITIEIEISKTVDTLRKQIFTQIGEQMSNYYNIKLFATNPILTELTVHSKTIAQCLIKENDKLILTADFAFGFRPVPAQLNIKHKITLANGATLTSTKPPEEPKKAQEKVAIPLSPPPPAIQPAPQEAPKPEPQEKPAEPAVQKAAQPAVQKAAQLPKVEQLAAQPQPVILPVTIPEIDDKILLENGPYHARCNVEFGSSKRYWEVKVEKIPLDEDDLVIGVCIASENKQATGGWHCDHMWGYQASVGKKIHYERDRETGHFDDDSESYGYVIRPNDSVGVLLNFKGKKVSLTFYKNSISCGEAYLIDLEGLKVANRTLTPFVNIGGQAQVTLDSKAQLPLDSFRFK